MTTAVVYYNMQRAKKKVEAATRVETFGKPAIGGPWSLVDSSGRPVTSGDMTGYHLLYFGFTFCPDICPNELGTCLVATPSGERGLLRLPAGVRDSERLSAALTFPLCSEN